MQYSKIATFLQRIRGNNEWSVASDGCVKRCEAGAVDRWCVWKGSVAAAKQRHCRQVLLHVNVLPIWVCQEIIKSVRECHFGYVHTVSVWDWQAYLLTDVSQMWIVPFIQPHTEVNWMWYVSMTMIFFFFGHANLHFIHAMIWNYT